MGLYNETVVYNLILRNIPQESKRQDEEKGEEEKGEEGGEGGEEEEEKEIKIEEKIEKEEMNESIDDFILLDSKKETESLISSSSSSSKTSLEENEMIEENNNQKNEFNSSSGRNTVLTLKKKYAPIVNSYFGLFPNVWTKKRRNVLFDTYLLYSLNQIKLSNELFHSWKPFIFNQKLNIEKISKIKLELESKLKILSLSSSPNSQSALFNQENANPPPSFLSSSPSSPPPPPFKMGKTNEVVINYTPNVNREDYVPSKLRKKQSSISISNRIRNESEPNIMEKLKEKDDNIKEYIEYEDENDPSFYLGHFLSVVYRKLEYLLESNLETNLLITSIISKLALHPNDSLHNFMFNNKNPSSPSVYSSLLTVAEKGLIFFQNFFFLSIFFFFQKR